MELHMVHINSKYVDAEGNLDGGYATNGDGLAVLGFMFEVGSTVGISNILFCNFHYPCEIFFQ